MPAIFISHSNRDKEVSERIKSWLAALGFARVFLDYDPLTGIPVGANWARVLYNEVARCHAVILVLTPNWLESKWCFAELQQANALGKIIIPVICSPIGHSVVFPEIQAVNLVGWNSEGQSKIERRLEAIAEELARGFRLEQGRPPFPGIFAFEFEDAAIYFGRDEEVRSTIEKLEARRSRIGSGFLLILGASGAGKSSLLKAGILPQLSRKGKEWLVLPTIRPQKAPLESLAKSLAQQSGKPAEWRDLHDELVGARAVAVLERLASNLRIGEARSATILISIDQFEEIFTIADATERATFLSLLSDVLAPTRGLSFLAVATGRTDVLHGLIEKSPLATLLETTFLPPVPLERVPFLVEGPAKVAGLLVEKGLTDAIVRDVESADALPLLAYITQAQ
jgi:hypothetical protein